ncbi:LAETG motif-containing sortase-dependent surface protein [Streptomyces massasporeus]|uniref:LAETG motif-containing sortase-dependent surface protein n=1 Tax=Streptomyces massasporeus TaxID=67324 RepID=A0ABW6L9H5_9ACTN
MKLRRAMAAAAATAVIAPVALLAAPAAYATDETTPTPSASVSESAPETSASPSATESTPAETTPAPSTSVSESAPETSSSPSASASESSPAPSASEPEESESPDPEPSVCEDTKVDVSISGLPGKIAAGSGWHKFSLNVVNNSDSTLNDVFFFAGTSADKEGYKLFKTKQVHLQAYNSTDKAWEDVDIQGYSIGGVGWTDELPADYEVGIPMRLNVSSSAPVGAGFTLGGGAYTDSDADCDGWGETSYKFQIVASGTDTDGTKPQTGGKLPVPSETPDKSDTTQVTGSLAETGSSSALPMISLVGGAAVVAGAGAIFVVRRRKAGVQA